MVPYTQRFIGVHLPRKLDPEFILFPHLTGVHLVGELNFSPFPPSILSQHRLAKSDPDRGMCFIGVEIVTFASMAHGQNIIGPIGCLVPGGCQGNMTFDFGLISQCLDPAEPIWVGPDRIENTGKVNI